MYGTSRIITGVARDHLIPPFLGSVSGRFKTPAIAITIQGIVSAVLALLSPFSELADMVSISTLFAFWVVSLGLMWRRSCTSGERAELLQCVIFQIIFGMRNPCQHTSSHWGAAGLRLHLSACGQNH